MGKMSKRLRKVAPILLLLAMALMLFPMMGTASPGITITSLSATSGKYGDVIKVKGSGVTAGVTVELYWDLVQAWDGEAGLLNSTKAKPDGTFEVWFTVPEAVNGKHYLWVKDTATGETYGGLYVANSEFVVVASLVLSPKSGLPGDEVTVYGYGFSAKTNVTIWFDTTKVGTVSETTSLGSFEKIITVPTVAYGSYKIEAKDNKGVTATATFKVGAAITISPESGPVGTVVEVKGRGFTKGEKIEFNPDKDWSEVVLDTTWCHIVDGNVTVKDDGTFTIDIVIPQVSKTGEYTLKVTDGKVTATADFEVTGLAEIKLEPMHGAPGETFTVYGYNFTQIKDTSVVVYFDVNKNKILDTGEVYETFKTNADGTFSGTFTVPALSTETYDVVAEQDSYNIETTEPFRVGVVIILLSPSEGETGTKVTLTGVGFTPKKEWNATFDGIAITDAAESVASDGTINYVFYVPMVDVGTYTVTALDIDTGIEVKATFKVTDKAYVELDPASAPNGYNVTIKGYHFPEMKGKKPDFVLYNATDEWTLTVNKATFDEDGNFTGWWIVPSETVLELGDYTMNITYTATYDGVSLEFVVQVPFSVVEEEIYISPRLATYRIGDTITFDIKSTFKKVDSYIEILDPEDNLYWKTDKFTDAMWIKVDDYYTVPYYSQVAAGNPMTLSSDAPLGTWTWIWYDKTGKQIENGTFTVIKALETELEEEISELSEDVSELSEDIADLEEDISGVKEDIAGVKEDVAGLEEDISGVKEDIAGVKEDVAGLEEGLTDLSEDVAALSEDVASASRAAEEAGKAVSELADVVSDVAERAASAKAAAEEAKAAAEEAGKAAAGLTPLIYGAIGVSLVAALAAIVSLVQLSRRIAG